jgi:hypothetical protein
MTDFGEQRRCVIDKRLLTPRSEPDGVIYMRFRFRYEDGELKYRPMPICSRCWNKMYPDRSPTRLVWPTK